MKLNTFFQRLGYDIESRELMLPYIHKWKSWYKGNVASFHYYNVYNGAKTIKLKRKTLNMGKKITQDFASYLMNEKVKFNFKDDNTSIAMNTILDDNDFYVLANEGIEKACALGTGAFVLSLTDLIYDENNGYINSNEAKLKIEFATADKIIPLSYRGTNIVECAFAVQRRINNKNVLVVTTHTKENEVYIIKNYLLKINKGGDLTDITDELEDSLKEFNTQSDLPWFSIIRPNIVNNLEDDSPFGISVFANAIDEMEGIDIAYDSFVNEFTLGKKRIFVESELLKVDPSTGVDKLVFDTNDVVFHQLPERSEFDGNTKSPITESNMQLRINEHKEGIQLNLNLLSSKVGMGDNMYKFDARGVTTATQVISEESELYRTIKKYEIILENALVDLLKTIAYISTTFLGMKANGEDITIDFDDSIIEDKAETKRQAMLEVNAGLIDAVEYFMITRNFTEEQATQYVEKIKKRIPQQEEMPEEE